jgi:hypothetical protein
MRVNKTTTKGYIVYDREVKDRYYAALSVFSVIKNSDLSQLSTILNLSFIELRLKKAQKNRPKAVH